VLTSDTLFEQETMPARMVVIGLGAIGNEIAQALSQLGVEVAGFDGAQTVAGLGDPAVNAVAVELLQREFPLHLRANAELTAADDGVRVRAGDVEVRGAP
jgi:dihydrolipoamide dehydrogenase